MLQKRIEAANQTHETDALGELKKSLLHHAFTGRL